MRVNWDVGFKRVRWAFLGIAWAIFVVVHVASQAPAVQWGENMVYMLFFTGGCVLFARACIWVVRGFFSNNQQVGS